LEAVDGDSASLPGRDHEGQGGDRGGHAQEPQNEVRQVRLRAHRRALRFRGPRRAQTPHEWPTHRAALRRSNPRLLRCLSVAHHRLCVSLTVCVSES
jgi:hypothetical protein